MSRVRYEAMKKEKDSDTAKVMETKLKESMLKMVKDKENDIQRKQKEFEET